jgi:hypothetical protein
MQKQSWSLQKVSALVSFEAITDQPQPSAAAPDGCRSKKQSLHPSA